MGILEGTIKDIHALYSMLPGPDPLNATTVNKTVRKKSTSLKYFIQNNSCPPEDAVDNCFSEGAQVVFIRDSSSSINTPLDSTANRIGNICAKAQPTHILYFGLPVSEKYEAKEDQIKHVRTLLAELVFGNHADVKVHSLLETFSNAATLIGFGNRHVSVTSNEMHGDLLDSKRERLITELTKNPKNKILVITDESLSVDPQECSFASRIAAQSLNPNQFRRIGVEEVKERIDRADEPSHFPQEQILGRYFDQNRPTSSFGLPTSGPHCEYLNAAQEPYVESADITLFYLSPDDGGNSPELDPLDGASLPIRTDDLSRI